MIFWIFIAIIILVTSIYIAFRSMQATQEEEAVLLGEGLPPQPRVKVSRNGVRTHAIDEELPQPFIKHPLDVAPPVADMQLRTQSTEPAQEQQPTQLKEQTKETWTETNETLVMEGSLVKQAPLLDKPQELGKTSKQNLSSTPITTIEDALATINKAKKQSQTMGIYTRRQNPDFQAGGEGENEYTLLRDGSKVAALPRRQAGRVNLEKTPGFQPGEVYTEESASIIASLYTPAVELNGEEVKPHITIRTININDIGIFIGSIEVKRSNRMLDIGT